MKILTLLCLTILMAPLVKSRDAVWGKRTNDDHVLYFKRISYVPQNGHDVNYIVRYKSKAGSRNKKTITAIYVFDRFANMSGADAFLLSGGPGYNFARIKLRNSSSKQINSIVAICGY